MTNICKDSWNTTRGTSIDEEQSEVTDWITDSVRCNSEAGNSYEVLNNHPSCTVLGFIREPGEEVAGDSLITHIRQYKHAFQAIEAMEISLTAQIPGGAVKRSALAVENPIAFRMIVMKKAMAYAGTVEAKNIKPGRKV